VRNPSIWACVLGVEKTVVERVSVEEDGSLVVKVRPRRSERQRCGLCGRRCPRYDWGDGRRRWRCLDLGYVLTYLEAEAPRVKCREHGVVVAAVPWARHGSASPGPSRTRLHALHPLLQERGGGAHARGLAQCRPDHHARGPRAAKEPGPARRPEPNRYRRDQLPQGQRYLIVVVDHDTGKLVWAANGRDSDTDRRFFTELGEERCAKIERVSCDGSSG
jgi:transposase